MLDLEELLQCREQVKSEMTCAELNWPTRHMAAAEHRVILKGLKWRAWVGCTKNECVELSTFLKESYILILSYYLYECGMCGLCGLCGLFSEFRFVQFAQAPSTTTTVQSVLQVLTGRWRGAVVMSPGVQHRRPARRGIQQSLSKRKLRKPQSF